MLANIRLVVAIVAATEAVSLSAADRPETVVAIAGYAAYAIWLCWVEFDGSKSRRPRLAAWFDAAWILLFAWLAGAPSSLFVMLLLFPVLFASLSFGFASGLLLSLFGAVGATAVVVAYRGISMTPELMLQPLSILLLGPLVAGLARAGVRMNEQLAVADRLLDEADPRLGVKRVAETVLRALVRHFDADFAIVLVWLPDSEPRLFRIDGRERLSELSGELRATLLDALVRLPPGVAHVHHVAHPFGRLTWRRYAGFDLADRRPTDAARATVQRLVESIDARSLIALPICRRAPHPCRLLLESGRRRYRARDAGIVASIVEQLAPVIENAGLLERLAEEAMATERARIGRDLHDSAIQPYLGLKYGIEALGRKAAPDNPLHADIHALKDLAIAELHELRELVTGMRNGTAGGDESLAPALRRQAKRFSELFGIEVAVRCDGDVPIRRRLAAEIFPMVGEALTNVRRHTNASRAEIRVEVAPDAYVLNITNAHDPSRPPPRFVPRSIVERADALNGRATVEQHEPGFTDLVISIPKPSEARTS